MTTKKQKEAIQKLFEGEEPWTKEQLNEKPKGWLINKIMADKEKLKKEIVKLFLEENPKIYNEIAEKLNSIGVFKDL